MVIALSVSAFAAEATITTSFTCTFTDNDYDSAITSGSLTGDNINVDGTWGGSFPDITPLIETVTPLANVTHIEVTVKASDMTPCWNAAAQKLELHWNTRDGENASTVAFDGDTAVVEADVPAGTTAVVLNPYAFSSEVGEITFNVTVKITGDFEAPAATETSDETDSLADDAAETAPETTTDAPATGIALAVVPAVVALAAVVVSKKH